MNHVAATKSVEKVEASVASSATHSIEIDTLGFSYASIDVAFSPFTAAATAAATVLRLAQSNTSGSGQTNVSGFVGGTDFTVAAGSTTGAAVGYSHRFDIDLRGRSRYLTVYATPRADGWCCDDCPVEPWRGWPGFVQRQGREHASRRLIA